MAWSRYTPRTPFEEVQNVAEYGIKKNAEGYIDPTAYKAITKVMQEESDQQRRINALIGSLKSLIDLAGYDLLNRIEVRDRKTGREYR